MIQIDELWIGDSLRHRPTGRQGTFEGLFEGQVRIRHANGEIRGSVNEFELVEEIEESPVDVFAEPTQVARTSSSEDHVVDLHVEKIAPDRTHEHPILLRALQNRLGRERLEEAIRAKWPTLTLIHGRGEGVLKSDILQWLQDYEEVQRVESVHAGGATLVHLRAKG